MESSSFNNINYLWLSITRGEGGGEDSMTPLLADASGSLEERELLSLHQGEENLPLIHL